MILIAYRITRDPRLSFRSRFVKISDEMLHLHIFCYKTTSYKYLK